MNLFTAHIRKQQDSISLDHLELTEEAALVRKAGSWTIEHKFVTKDIDPVNNYYTSTIGEMIVEYVEKNDLEEIHPLNIELRKSTII